MEFQKAKRVPNIECKYFQTRGINTWNSVTLEVAMLEKMKCFKNVDKSKDERPRVSLQSVEDVPDAASPTKENPIHPQNASVRDGR